jgi:ABC-2 type transport system permease protein
VLVGRSLADLSTAAPCALIVAATGLAIGWHPNPSATINAWPMQHPVAASLLWSVAFLVIFAPLATLLYRRRTTD